MSLVGYTQMYARSSLLTRKEKGSRIVILPRLTSMFSYNVAYLMSNCLVPTFFQLHIKIMLNTGGDRTTTIKNIIVKTNEVVYPVSVHSI